MKISKLIILLFFTPLMLFSQNKKRLALVIGISNYNNTLKLENPVNDARLIATSLNEVNFEVILKEDVSKKELADAIKVFSNKLIDSSYEAGFFYYAGHGIQVENTNYLVPIDANIDQNNDKYEIEEKCYSVQRLMSYFNSERLSDKVLISVLDACRNNPFIRNRSIGEGGLSKIDAVSGSLIAYSTEPGKVALDGKGKANSIYSEVLSKNLKTPNLTLEEVFKNVRTEVEYQTNYKQSPREESALKGAPFYFSNKKNYNKIDIVEIENEFKSLIISGSFEKAISKGNILKELFKSRVDSISALKYVDILIELSNVYYKHADDSSNKEGWNYYHKLASNDLFDAMNILKKYSLNSKNDKYLFSKSLINYIDLQTNLDENERLDNYNELLKKANELVSFNEINFGSNSYYTACSYFLYGWLNRDSSFVEAYKYCNKAYDIITKNGLEINYDTNYYYLNEVPYYILKWNFKTLNELISYDISQNKKNQFLYTDYKSFLNNYNKDIEEISKHISNYDKEKNWDFYNEITRLYNNYSLNIEDSSFKIDCIEKALKTNEISLKYSSIYSDSILIYERIARVCDNIVDISGKFETKLLEEIQNSTLISLDIAYKYLDSYSIIQTTKNYISYFFDYYKKDNQCFTKHNFLDVIERFNEYYSYLIADYKSLKNKEDWNSEIKSLFEDIRASFSMVDTIDYSYRRIEAEQYIEFSTNCSSDGYGSPAYLIALEHRAVVLESSEDIEEQMQAKKTYIELIKLNKQYNKNWKPESIKGCFLGSNSREECIANLLSDVYYNYSSNLISDSSNNKNNSKDSALIFSFQEFIQEYNPSLKKLSKFYYSTISSFQASVFYYQKIDAIKAIEYCDSGINVINYRLKLDSIQSMDDYISNYEAEEKIIWFYNIKGKLLKKINIEKYLESRREFLKRLQLFKSMNNLTPTLELYHDLISFYYFDMHNYDESKKIALKAYDDFKYFNSSEDILNPENDKEWKLNNLDLLRIFLELGVDNLQPTKKERELCIEQCKFNINFINKNWDSIDIAKNKNVWEVLSYTLYNIEYLSYLNKDYKTSIYYNKKRLKLLISKSSEIEVSNQILSQLRSLSNYYLNDKDSINAQNSYIQMVSESKLLDSCISNNFSFTIDTFNYNSCIFPYLHLKIYSPLQSWPCIEFDVNNNTEVDSLIDLRYFIDNKNVLKAENIKEIKKEIGGFAISGLHENGKMNDTSKNIYFDNNKTFETRAYYFLKEEIIDDDLHFGKLQTGEKLNLWDLYIPINEIQKNSDNTISFLIENISKGLFDDNTLIRNYDKNTIPMRAFVTGFKDCIKINLK
jgi:hypothetical protein